MMTHGAYVFLAGDRAYKLKRDVKYSYMDFSTQAQRDAAALAEIRYKPPHRTCAVSGVWRRYSTMAATSASVPFLMT